MSEAMQDSDLPQPAVSCVNGDSMDATSNSIISGLQAELDELKAELKRVQIESESDLNESNGRVLELETKLSHQSNLQTQLDVSLKEVNSLKETLKTRAGSNEQSQEKISKLESEKNDLLEVVRDSQKEYADLEAETKSKAEQLDIARAEIRRLETTLATSQEAERVARLQVQALESSSNLVSADRDFYVKELEESRMGWQKFRTDSHQEISRLQTELDKLTHAHEHLTASNTALQTQRTSLQEQLNEALEKNKDISHRHIEAEAAFQKEIDLQKRVTQMMDQRDKDRSRRMEEIESEWNTRRTELEEREKALDDELGRERARYNELEKKLAQNQSVLDNVLASETSNFDFSDEGHSNGDITLGNATPGSPLNRRRNGSALRNGLSPAAAMVNNLQRSGKSLTQIYTEKMLLEEQLAESKDENLRLSECLATIMGEIQDKAPVIQQQRLEAERIRLELDNLTTELTTSIEQKEEAERKYESCLLDLKGLQRDHDLSNRQLQDLSLQVRVLTKEVTIRDRGDNRGLNGDEDDLANEVRNGYINLDEETEDPLLSNDLVTFKDIADLQHKNLKLLAVARQLTAKLQELESNRAMSDDEDEDDQAAKQAVEEAHELILRLKSDVESAQRKSEALSRERDMLRRMLSQSQQTNLSSEASHINQGHGHQSINGSHQQFEELHAQFEAYKTEIGADSKRLNEDLNRARSDLSQAQVSLAKANAQIEYLNERHRNIDQTSALQTQEIQSLTKTSIKLQEQLVQNEMRLHQANESATELKTRCTVLQHQVHTLTTEKEVWKGVESRLTAENANLIRERDGISGILKNMRSMQGELERNSADGRRRLENQVTRLEARVQELKDKLKNESESLKHVTLQRELDNKDFQMRIDKLSADYVAARENLVVAQTKQEHLEARVKELSGQITMKEDRLNVYERYKVSNTSTGESSGEGDGTQASTLSQQQKLEIENAQLKRDLIAAKEETAKAKQNVEEFKVIAQNAETALASLTSTHDEYKSVQEADLAQKQTAFATLEEQTKKLTENLEVASALNKELQQMLDNQRSEFEVEKARLLSTLTGLQDIEDRVKARESELRAEGDQQRALANENHNRYQAEVQNHAISLNELSTLKEQLDKARAKITAANSSADTANAKLQASEASWAEQKVAFAKEIEGLSERCEDLRKQNTLLHEHLESVSAQAAKISNDSINSAAGMLSTVEESTLEDTDENKTQSIQQLRGLIRYLRNNHDLIQNQLSLAKHESERLQKQLHHTSKDLDQTRSELSQERERTRQGYVSSSEYTQLLDQINTLNMVRESNATLRDEFVRSDRKAKDLEARLQQTNAKLEPLQTELREMKAVVQQYQQEIALLNEDNERWKTRNQQILEKYERIDPAEVQALRDKIVQHEAEITRLRAECAEKLDRFTRLQSVAREQRNSIKATETELSSQREAIQKAEGQAQEQREMVGRLQQEKADLERSLADAIVHKNQLAALQTAIDQSKVEMEKRQAVVDSLTKANSALMAEKQAIVAAKQNLESEMEKLTNNTSQPPPAPMPEEMIEAEVTKRLNAKLASIPSDGGSTTTSASSDELQKAEVLAIAQREAAVQQAIEETTKKVTAECEKTKEADIAKLKLELSAPSDEAVNTLVTQKQAALRAEWEAEAKVLKQQLESQLKAALEASEKAEKAVAQQPVSTSSPAVGYSELQFQEKVEKAVSDALSAKEIEYKNKEAALIEAHRVDKVATIEDLRTKIANEAKTKEKVTQNQLKRCQAQLAQYKERDSAANQSQSAPTPAAISSTPATNTIPAPAPSAIPQVPVSGITPAAAPVAGPPATATPSIEAPPQTSPIPALTGDGAVIRPASPTITFGRGSRPAGRGIGRVARGGRGRGADSLPAEGRMMEKPGLSGGTAGRGGPSLAIRGVAATKRGALGAGMLNAAVRAATSGASTPNELSTSEGQSMANFGTAAKRAREEEAASVQAEASNADGSAKRPKSNVGGDETGNQATGNAGGLASRLSKGAAP